MNGKERMRGAIEKYMAAKSIGKGIVGNGFIDPNLIWKGPEGPPGTPKREYTTVKLNYLGVPFSTYIPKDILHFLDHQDEEDLPLEVLELIKMVDKPAFEDILKSWKKAYLDKWAEEVFYRGEQQSGQ